MPKTTEVQCPICKGAMWDNRADKKNPRAPDFKCADKNCEGVIWPPKPGQRSPVSLPPANQKQELSSGPHIPGLDAPIAQSETGAPPADVESGSVVSRLDKLFALFAVCLDHVVSVEAPKLAKSDIGTSPESAAAMCATLFIQACNKGLAA